MIIAVNITFMMILSDRLVSTHDLYPNIITLQWQFQKDCKANWTNVPQNLAGIHDNYLNAYVAQTQQVEQNHG